MKWNDNTITKMIIKTYYEEGRDPWCRLDDMIYSPAGHCQNCPLYHGTLTMTCKRAQYCLVK
jgi:hypothetical protein